MPDIIQQSDDLRNGIIDRFTGGLAGIEQRVYDRVVQLIETFKANGGNFEIDISNRRGLLQLQSAIEEVLKEAGYFRSVNRYVADLNKITENTAELHKAINKLDVAKASLTPFQQVAAENAIQIMNEGGLSVNFVQPVTQIINEALSFGSSIADTRASLQNLIIGNEEKVGKLQSYLTVTARDTVTQLQGAQNQAILQEENMPYVRYVGGLLDDSRAQCVRWRGMKYIAVKDLENEIAQAIKNQDNSKKTDGHRWSGMIPGTNASNFLVRRGGYGCLHNAFPSRLKF